MIDLLKIALTVIGGIFVFACVAIPVIGGIHNKWGDGKNARMWFYPR